MHVTELGRTGIWDLGSVLAEGKNWDKDSAQVVTQSCPELWEKQEPEDKEYKFRPIIITSLCQFSGPFFLEIIDLQHLISLSYAIFSMEMIGNSMYLEFFSLFFLFTVHKGYSIA